MIVDAALQIGCWISSSEVEENSLSDVEEDLDGVAETANMMKRKESKKGQNC